MSIYSIPLIDLNHLSQPPRMRTAPFHQPNQEDSRMSLINTQIKPFKVTAYHNGEFVEITDATLKGKWSVVIFMPAAFTFNCPTEVEDAAENYAEFQKAGAEVYVVTTDTHFSHK